MHIPPLSSRVLAPVIAVLAVVVIWLFRIDLKGLAAVLWPLVAAGALYGFRSELNGLLQRLKRVGASGAEFGELSIAAQIMAIPVDQALKAVAPTEEQPSYIRARVEALRPELNAREPNDQQRREHLLMLRLAEAQQERDFLMIWANIFASQHEALVAMVGASEPIDISAHYEAHVERRRAIGIADTTTPATFELWVSFLLRMRLATVAGRNATITDQGRGFLNYASLRNLPRYSSL